MILQAFKTKSLVKEFLTAVFSEPPFDCAYKILFQYLVYNLSYSYVNDGKNVEIFYRHTNINYL